MAKKISILVGSLRRASFARKVALNAVQMFPEGYQAEIVEICRFIISIMTILPWEMCSFLKVIRISVRRLRLQTAFCSLLPKTTGLCRHV